MKLNRTKNEMDREARNDENENWNRLEKLSKEVDDLVLESGGDSNLEVVQARGGEPVLNDRLNKIDQTIKNNHGDLVDQIRHLDNLKMDKNTNDIGINQINKNKGLIDETYLSDELKQQIAGDTPIHSVPAIKSITNSRIAERAVSPTETTFARLGKNKFNGMFVNAFVQGTEVGEFREGFGKSAIVRVEPNKRYVVSKSDSDRFRVFKSKNYPKHGDEVVRESFVDGGSSTGIVSGDYNYLIIYVSQEFQGNDPEWLQVEERESGGPTEYSPPGVVLDLEKSSIKNTHISNGLVTGLLAGGSSRVNINTVDKVVEARNPGSIVLVANQRFEINEGDYDFSDFPYNTIVLTFNKSNKNIEFYGVDSVQDDLDDLVIIGLFRINEGIYNVFGIHRIDGEVVNNGNSVPRFERPKFLISEIVNEDYIPTVDLYVPESTIDDVYDIYDDLVSNFPDYVTREKLGEEYTGLPIYLYNFKPPMPISPREIVGYRHPKVFFSHIHGHEKRAAFGGASFFYDLCHNWENNSTLQMMRWNIEISVVPIVNPWGFNNNDRLNSRGVDINRNFPTGWTPDYNDIDYDYPGESPASEVETQLILNIMETEEFDLAIDHHQYGGLRNSDHALYLSSRDEDTRAVLGSVVQSYDPYIKKTYAGIPNNNQSIVRVSGYDGVDNSLAYVEWSYRGVPSVLIEAGAHLTERETGEDIQKFQSYLAGNTIAKIIMSYDWLL